MDGVEGVAAGEPGEVPAGGGPTKDGLGGHFILVSDPGARRTNLVEATPIGHGAGKGGQSTKGSQGLSNLVGVDGRLGGDGRVTAVWSRREGRVDPGESGIAWRRVSGVSPPPGYWDEQWWLEHLLPEPCPVMAAISCIWAVWVFALALRFCLQQ